MSHVTAIYNGTGTAHTTEIIMASVGLNISLLLISLVQIQYFMTTYHQFGQMIKLVGSTLL
jgi:uncharacterized protein YacL